MHFLSIYCCCSLLTREGSSENNLSLKNKIPRVPIAFHSDFKTIFQTHLSNSVQIFSKCMHIINNPSSLTICLRKQSHNIKDSVNRDQSVRRQVWIYPGCGIMFEKLTIFKYLRYNGQPVGEDFDTQMINSFLSEYQSFKMDRKTYVENSQAI